MTKLCKDCMIKFMAVTVDQFEKAVSERRIPKWYETQTGRTPACVKCGKEGEVYG